MIWADLYLISVPCSAWQSHEFAPARFLLRGATTRLLWSSWLFDPGLGVCRKLQGIWLYNIAPIVNSVEVLEILIESSTSINLVIWDVLDEDSLDVGRGEVYVPFLDNIVPAEPISFEKRMLLDLRAITGSRAEALGWVPVEQGDEQGPRLVR